MSAAPNHIRLERLVEHPDVDERWLMARISENPEILGLGHLVVDEKRTRSSRGRLELALHDPDANRHYHIDIQTGATDEKHLIRVVELWAAERKKAPGSGHYAVVVAEEIPPRFRRVARLLSKAIPLVVLQMAAVQTGDGLGLLFTKLIDVMERDSAHAAKETPAVSPRPGRVGRRERPAPRQR